jgi:cobyrinic acid a,c-diamide synthase
MPISSKGRCDFLPNVWSLSNLKIPRIVIGGTHSGVGKTSVAVGIMGALARKGRRVQGFKIGPDFLDTSFHTAVTGRPSRNLDSWMIPRKKIPSIFTSGCESADIAVIEGVMGVFDGIDGKSEIASTSELAKTLKAPVILVIDAYGLAGSAAALVLGYKSLDPELRLSGVILNRVAGDTHAEMCRDAIKRHSKVPVLGAIPVNRDIALPGRHLGLVPATEMENRTILDRIVDHVASHVDLDRIEDLARSAGQLPVSRKTRARHGMDRDETVIAIARDKAFNFYYQENLDGLAGAGARIEFFSPIEDQAIPENASGLYLGGGYPEVYASALAANHSMLRSVAKYAEGGMPIYAECGGLMYLTRSIQDQNGVDHRTVGLLDAKTSMVKRLTLSYTLGKATRPNILTRRGNTVRGHEFHFSALKELPRDAEFAYELKRGIGIGDGRDGWTCYETLASYMHTSFASDERMAERFVDACAKYSRG